MIGVINILNVIAVVISIVFGFIPFNGTSIGEVSDKYLTLITPVDYAFAIWGLIYVALIAFSIWQLFPSNSDSNAVKAVGLWLIVASIFQALWVVAWDYEDLQLSALLMFSLWSALLNLNVNLARADLSAQPSSAPSPVLQSHGTLLLSLLFGETQSIRSILLRLPFGLWFGWITVAFLINITAVFYWAIQITFFNTLIWAALALSLAASFSIIWGLITIDFILPLAVAWGSLGIFLAGYDDDMRIVSLCIALALVAFVIINVVLRMVACLCEDDDEDHYNNTWHDEESLLHRPAQGDGQREGTGDEWTEESYDDDDFEDDEDEEEEMYFGEEEMLRTHYTTTVGNEHNIQGEYGVVVPDAQRH